MEVLALRGEQGIECCGYSKEILCLGLHGQLTAGGSSEDSVMGGLTSITLWAALSSFGHHFQPSEPSAGRRHEVNMVHYI